MHTLKHIPGYFYQFAKNEKTTAGKINPCRIFFHVERWNRSVESEITAIVIFNDQVTLTLESGVMVMVHVDEPVWVREYESLPALKR